MTLSNSEKRYLLDTNILSNLVRQPQGIIARHISSVGESNVCTSIIVAAELRYGAAKRASERLTRQLETILALLDVIPFDAPADPAYGQLRATLERRGYTIGANDLLVAAQAQTLGCTLVTDNVPEFAHIPNLKIENWLRDPR